MKAMNRREFLSVAAMLVATPVLAALPASESKPRKAAPKIGRISTYDDVGFTRVKPGDLCPKVDGERPPDHHHIQRLDDIEGWYEYLTEFRDKNGEYLGIERENGEFITRRRYCNVSVVHYGTDPRFSQFKKPTI